MTTPTTNPETVPDPVVMHGAGLLGQVSGALTRYLVVPSMEGADAVVLWVAATHAVPCWGHAARLVIRAPEERCGKSRLLDVIEALCHQPLITVNASTAAVYRAIGLAADDPSTLLIDEADTIFGPKAGESNEELRGLLNAGHQRNRPPTRWNAAAYRAPEIRGGHDRERRRAARSLVGTWRAPSARATTPRVPLGHTWDTASGTSGQSAARRGTRLHKVRLDVSAGERPFPAPRPGCPRRVMSQICAG